MRIAAIFLIILLSFCKESKGDRVEYKCLKEESHPITTMVCNKTCIPIVTISYTCVLKELRIVIDGKIYRPTGLDYIGEDKAAKKKEEKANATSFENGGLPNE